jgi:hypothetical protein
MTVLGERGFRYQLAAGGRNWGELPDGWRFGDVAAVGADRMDRIYVFTRGEPGGGEEVAGKWRARSRHVAKTHTRA